MRNTLKKLGNSLIFTAHTMMLHFSDEIIFKHPWRKYQQRALHELENFIGDKHLHIVAPPGSGKTLLGLEVAKRINKPTLIFAPTITIRNQWVQRFKECFTSVPSDAIWISTSLKDPQFLTVCTYQALHAIVSDTAEQEDFEESQIKNEETKEAKFSEAAFHVLLQKLKEKQIGTFVLDEAHHLKNAWWKSLIQLKEALDPMVVALTATPPYDVSGNEWHRYITLNGAIDAEISIPELIIEGDLCPHQDYIYFTTPTQQERNKIDALQTEVKHFYDTITSDINLTAAIASHPWILEPEKDLENLYEDIELYAAMLIFLSACKIPLTEQQIVVIGDKNATLPLLNYYWLEKILSYYLLSKNPYFLQYQKHRDSLLRHLKRIGVFDFNKLSFVHNSKMTQLLDAGLNKLGAIPKIAETEYASLGKDLRLVILVDFIRKEFLHADAPLSKMGVIPIFEILRRNKNNPYKIAVLTGSLIIIPASSFEKLSALNAAHTSEPISFSLLDYDENYYVLHQNLQFGEHVVRLITALFECGEMQVLIGTKALLGEGWDAPSINALILASTVGSFVTSNQMRGRAIRTQQNNLLKTSNIWHLACIDLMHETGGNDYDTLCRRFKTFVGINYKGDPIIENGITRLSIPDHISSPEQIEIMNTAAIQLAEQRDLMRERWKVALPGGQKLVEEIIMPLPSDVNYRKRKALYYNKTIKYLFAETGLAILTFITQSIESIVRSLRNVPSLHDIKVMLFFVFGGFMIYLFPKIVRNMRLYINYRDIARDAEGIARSLITAMYAYKYIKTPFEDLHISSTLDDSGAIYCHLAGGTTYECTLFLDCLEEIIGGINNPKYLITRESKLLKLIHRKDFHSVPLILSKNYNYANSLANAWRKHVGKCRIIYTREPEGRRILLHARFNALSAQFQTKTERNNVWR